MKVLFLDLFRKNKTKQEKQTGYIVKVDSHEANQKEYRFLKNHEGKWISENHGNFKVTPDDEAGLAIKQAIDEYESGN